MAQAIQFDKFGEAKEVLKLNTINKPEIKSDSQYLVKVIATSINPSDLNTIAGTYGIKAKEFPATPGFEASAVVEEVGKAVTGVKVGQRLHIRRPGAWTSHAVLDEKDFVVSLPDTVSDFQGAQLTVNPFSAIAMIEELNIKGESGDYLLQDGAASALGRIMIQLGKAKGFKTINVVRRNEQIEELKSLGADFVINSETEDIVARVNEITQNVGVKYAIDCVGGEVGGNLLKSLGVGGTLLVYGRLSPDVFNLQSGAMIFKGTTVKGFWLMTWMQRNPQKIKSSYEEIVGLISDKKITLPHKSFPASEFLSALDHCKAPGKSEKTILTFNY